jgi:hypothetical protein
MDSHIGCCNEESFIFEGTSPVNTHARLYVPDLVRSVRTCGLLSIGISVPSTATRNTSLQAAVKIDAVKTFDAKASRAG